MKISFVAACFMVFSQIPFADINTWSVLPAYGGALQRRAGGLVYLPDSNRFLLSMGITEGYSSPRYSEQVLSLTDSTWKNFFPEGKLGVWGNDTGPSTAPGFSYAYFKMTDVQGNTRPYLGSWNGGNAYCQYAFDPDNIKLYYYTAHLMVVYDPRTRIWEVLDAPEGVGTLAWGSLCYDAYNKEIVLFGGTCNLSLGNPGTWTYQPATKTWTRLTLTVQPSARCGSPMVYDPANRKIILFSGDHRDSMTTDTWTYDAVNRTWSQKHPALSPRPRAGHAMIYLPKSGKVVMMGGYSQVTTTGGSQNEYAKLDSFEIWTYDAASGPEGAWSLIKHFSAPQPVCMPGGTPYCLAVAADTGDRIIAIGGTNGYTFGATTYYMECDPSQTDPFGSATYGFKTDSTWVRGERHDPAWYHSDDASIDTAFNETVWCDLPPNTWTLITQPKSPLWGKDYGTAVFSPDHDALIRWGGGHATTCFNDVPQYHMSKNRWYIGYRPESSLDGHYNSGGPAPTFAGRPTLPSHKYDNYDYCTILKKVVDWNGRETRLYNPETMDWDTIRIPLYPTMGKGVDYHKALNATPHGMTAWGTPDGDDWNYSRLWIMDTLTLAWKPLPTKLNDPIPVIAENAGMVYDGKRDRLLFTRSADLGQVWEYRFADSVFAKLNPVNAAAITTMGQPRECAYLPDEDKVFFMGLATLNGVEGHLLYDCSGNQWQTLPVTAPGSLPLKTYGTGWALRFDPKRKIIILTTNANQIFALRPVDSPHTATEASSAPPQLSFGAAPNPSHSTFSFGISGAGTGYSLKIYDLRGKLVRDMSGSVKKGTRAKTTLTFRADGLPSGVYVATLKSGRLEFRKTLVLAR